VWETIRYAGEGRTVIIVEHKIEHVLDYVDRVVLFNKSGEIIADGPPGELFAQHRDRLAGDGIWYPGVWDDYVNSGRYAPPLPLPGERTKLIELSDFAVRRGKEEKLRIRGAIVSAGEWIAVVGPNGAGKSTLLLGLMRLLATSGGYKLLERPAAEYRELSGEIAFVFQNPEFQFVTNSVYDEVAFSLRQEGRSEDEVRAKTSGLLAEFELTERQDNHPFQLSLGQKRRLSVASAIVKEQRILLLDEPTFGQDAKNTFALLERLEAWRRQGTAIVMVTHDPDIVKRFATRVWVVRGGELQADLAPQDWQGASAETEPDDRPFARPAKPEAVAAFAGQAADERRDGRKLRR
jgi:energy-coupling factor transport system ATP-binding protein